MAGRTSPGCINRVRISLAAHETGAAAEPVLAGLGFTGDALATALAAYRDQHPHGPRRERPRLRGHVQNLDPAQWRYMYEPPLLASFEHAFPQAAAKLGYPPSDPALLIDDRPRREAYLARILANRGETQVALARLDAALHLYPGAPSLLAARQLIAHLVRRDEGP
jgi:hypothetical protein